MHEMFVCLLKMTTTASSSFLFILLYCTTIRRVSCQSKLSFVVIIIFIFRKRFIELLFLLHFKVAFSRAFIQQQYKGRLIVTIIVTTEKHVIVTDTYYCHRDNLIVTETILLSQRQSYCHRYNLIVTETLQRPCLLYTSPSPRDLSTSRMPSSA